MKNNKVPKITDLSAEEPRLRSLRAQNYEQ